MNPTSKNENKDIKQDSNEDCYKQLCEMKKNINKNRIDVKKRNRQYKHTKHEFNELKIKISNVEKKLITKEEVLDDMRMKIQLLVEMKTIQFNRMIALLMQLKKLINLNDNRMEYLQSIL